MKPPFRPAFLPAFGPYAKANMDMQDNDSVELETRFSTLAACRGEGEGCWDLPGEWGQLLPTAHRGCHSSCPLPTATEVAAEKPVEELERHHVEQDTLCSRAAGGVGSRHTASINRGGREGVLGSREERAQYDPKQKALELAKTAPESEGTTGMGLGKPKPNWSGSWRGMSKATEGLLPGESKEDVPLAEEDQVREYFSKLDIDKSIGLDGRHPQVLRELADVFMRSLLIIFA
ncbi:hypothetical protein QYF61_012528 [Mycteria americana]|uniref:Uncharacterized protein n=1 Tax=Mycteria americana TaxID=33587 RepID=A0AAN7NFH8_MYCAM|nr:hypothetical protein QYF61_012528 [Mycteria americana]